MKNTKKLFRVFAVVISVLLLAYLLVFIVKPAVGCVGSGGKLFITSVCKVSDIFQNTCNGFGACAPEYRVNKLQCQCHQGCFDGSICKR